MNIRRYLTAGIVGLLGLVLGVSAAGLTAHLMEPYGLVPLVVGTFVVTGIALVTFRFMGQLLLPTHDPHNLKP